jgi:16S rRNA processing protein RimM
VRPREEGREREPDAVLVGRVRRAHGVRGEVVVEALSDVAGRFTAGARFLVTPVGGARRALRAEGVRSHNEGLLVRFEGVATRDEADRLRGADLEVPSGDSPRPPAGAFYYFELVGCRCRDQRHGELGRVAEVVEDGGGLLLEIESPGRRLLVPFVRAFLKSVDVSAGEIELELPEGLIEACESTS